MNIRERTEQLEFDTLSPLAMLSKNSRGRVNREPKCDIRTDFCRDRDRIIHSKSFRRLKQKTQVFLSPEGDHYRTRLTHTLEVAQIARTISRALRLNEDLTEAIALGHDLGHTPFGHAGERALNGIVPGGFRHYDQSVRVVTLLEKDYSGLNLTFETIDGIKNHTRGEWPKTLEGQVVRHSDRIAYLNHDIEDAITAGVFSEDSIPKDISDILGNRKSARITTLINAVIENSGNVISLGEGSIKQAYDALTDLMFEKVYLDTEAAPKEQEPKVNDLIRILYEGYMKNPDKLPSFYQMISDKESRERAVADYISGMSDAYAIYCFEELFVPRPWAFNKTI